MGVLVRFLRGGGSTLAGACLLLLGAARAGEGMPGSPIRVFPSSSPFRSGFGTAIGAAGDVDGDGFVDLVIGAPIQDLQGLVLIVSGKDGTVLRTLVAPGWGDGFGESLAVIGDIDGRGLPDILVGAPSRYSSYNQRAYAMVFAGEDGAVLFSSSARDKQTAFGYALAGLGDLNGDGIPDFAIGAPGWPYWDSRVRGTIDVWSAADGTHLRTLSGPEVGDDFGSCIAPLGDLDGDAVPDFAVGSPGHSVGGKFGVGRITVFSGATFEEIRSFTGPGEFSYFGSTFTALGGTGASSRILVVPSAASRRGHPAIDLLDAGTGRLVRRFRIPGFQGIGGILSTIGDQDGDGVPEIVASAMGQPDTDAIFDSSGIVVVLSGATGRVLFARHGWPNENLWTCHVSVGDMDGDGREDLAIASRTIQDDAEVRVYRVDPMAGRSRVRVGLQREPSLLPAGGGTWFVEFGFGDFRSPLTLSYRGTAWVSDGLFIEDEPGSGNYLAIHRESVGAGTYFWDPDPALRRLGLLELAGRRLQFRDGSGNIYFRGTVPSPTAEDFWGRSPLAAPGGAPIADATGTVRVTTAAARGTTRIDLRTRRLPRGAAFEVWVEEAAGTGTFWDSGPLHRDRLLLDTGRGDPLPGFAPDGQSLSGRLVEVRDGDTVVLRGTLP